MQWRDFLIFAVFPCLFMGYVSHAYFKADRSAASLLFRLTTAAHGASAATLYLISLIITATTNPSINNATILLVLYLLPAMLIIFSLASYRGPRHLHTLQLFNVPVMLVTAFIGFILVAIREI